MDNYSVKSKKALFIGEKQVTDFEWDEIVELKDHALLIENDKGLLDIEVLNKLTQKGFYLGTADYYDLLSDNLILIKDGETSELYTLDGNELESDVINIEHKNNIFVVKYNYLLFEKYSIYNEEGKKVLPNSYDKVELLDKCIIVTSYGKKGVYSYDGTELIPMKYSEISWVTKAFMNCLKVGYSVSNTKTLYGLYSFKGEELLPIRFEEIEVERNVIIVKKDGLKGLYGGKNRTEELLSPIFDDIEYGNKVVKCKTGTKTIYYIPSLDKFFQEDCISVDEKGKSSYWLEGKWRKLK